MTGSSGLRVERTDPEDGISVLRLNRPERLNALTMGTVQELHEHLDALKRDDGCRVVILTGAGRGFCAGVDLKGGDPTEIPPLQLRPEPIRTWQVAEHFSAIVLRMRTLGKPVIAAVNGPAAGAGLSCVLASDVRIAAESARFAVSFIRAGFSACDMGSSWLLPRIVGVGRAHELMLTGRTIDASEALDIGLVTDVVADGEVMAAALSKAREIMENTPWGVALTKEVMWSSLEIPGLHAAIDLENRTQVMTKQTADAAEAQQAFLEGRRPTFTYE